MNHLYRELAPISDAAWEEIEKEARRTLKTTLQFSQLRQDMAVPGDAAAPAWTVRELSHAN